MTSGATEIGSGVLDHMVAGGLLYAVPLFVISLVLFVEGSKRIPMTVGIVGFIVGFGLVGELYEFLGVNPPISEAQFRFIAAAAVGVISVSVAIITRFLAILNAIPTRHYMQRKCIPITRAQRRT